MIGSSDWLAGLVDSGNEVIEEAIVCELVAGINLSWHEIDYQLVAVVLDGSLRVIVMGRVDVELRK